MNRYSSYGKKDTPWQPDGDIGFQGIDMLHERSFLSQGMLARSENKRLRDGPAVTRAGTSYPEDFNPVFEGEIIGSYIYSNPNSEEVMLVATKDADYIWQLQFGKDPVQVDLDSGQSTGTGNCRVEFVQAFDKVLMLRRFTLGQPTLVWDGDVTHKFVPIALSTDGLKLVPTTWFGEPFENRVLYYFAYGLLDFRTKFIMSDILDYSSYDEVWAVFRIAAAQSDQITRLLAYQKASIIAFMRHSIFMIENFTVDPTQALIRVLSNKVGNVGNKVPLLVGAEAFFLSEHGGFYRVSQVISDQIASEPIPISRSIQPIIDRINWARTDSLGLDFVACSESLGDYCFFAVPLDDASGANNAILVYNTSTREWESAPDWWDDANFRIDALHVTRYNQNRRLFGLDYVAQKIYLLYDGVTDQINGNDLAIKDMIETRGYVSGDPSSVKRFERLLLGIRTSDPSAQVTAISDGVNEEKELATITKNRLKFYVHGHPDFDPITGNPNEQKREDYSVAGDEEFAGQDFEALPVGGISVLPATSTDSGAVKQQSLERMQIRQNGRWCSIRVENTSGQCDILGVGIESIPISENIKTIA